jgi:hypothetical protein
MKWTLQELMALPESYYATLVAMFKEESARH